jgi:phosphosulfolactate phosphohydrolase-like enzyme
VDRSRTVQIDAVPESAYRYLDCDAVVYVDVMLSSTTLVTAVAQGREAFLAFSADDARALAAGLTDPILACDGHLPPPSGFDTAVGPSVLEAQGPDRPLVLLGPWAQAIGGRWLGPEVYVACLRNVSATAAHIAQRHRRVALIGAGDGHEQRCEDQMAAAWIARKLFDRGFEARGLGTLDEVDRWRSTDASLAGWGKSAETLRREGRQRDLDLVLGRVDDLDVACTHVDGAVHADQPRPRLRAPSPEPVRWVGV